MTEPMDTDAILAFRDATKAFGGKDVVKNVSLRFSKNSMTAIVGTSGAGKSTLLRLANGLIKPDSGEVLFGQGKAAQAPDPVARRRIGFVFQSIALFPHLTVAENIAIGPSLRSLPTDKDDLFRWLDLVELPRALADRLPHQLSGGQQQRVGIARALAPAPEMLLLDEPFAALDPVTRNSLAQKVRVLHEQLGLTSIIVTHDMAEALLMADRVLVMHEGRLVADETPGALLAGAGGAGSAGAAGCPARASQTTCGAAGMNALTAAFTGLGDKLAAHVLLSTSALALGLFLALPLSVWSSRSPRVAAVSLGLASLIQTIPGLALLALFYPILVSLGALTGLAIPALGFVPALLALTLYALLPILRNAVTARQRMDHEVLEAADALGMTSWQKLRLVEIPLALPYIVAGIRTAVVWTVGAATLATMVGQPSLGDPIFAGLQIQNWSLVLAGCSLAAALALAVDTLIGQIETGLITRQKWRMLLAGGAITLGIFASILAVYIPGQGDRPRVVIGAKNFSEQFILARLIGHRLEDQGYRVEYRDGLGSSVAYKALAAGQIDAYVEYSGTLWAGEMGRSDILPRTQTLPLIADWAGRHGGVSLLGPLGFENAYAFAMRDDRARQLGITSLEDLAAQSTNLTLGADLEFLSRPEWYKVYRAYGIEFAGTRRFAPSLMYNALVSGDADVISAFSSDGRIAADRLVVLTDPRGALPGYDALLLVSRRAVEDVKLVAALRPLLGRIGVEQMRVANYSVDRSVNKLAPGDAARELECALRLRVCAR